MSQPAFASQKQRVYTAHGNPACLQTMRLTRQFTRLRGMSLSAGCQPNEPCDNQIIVHWGAACKPCLQPSSPRTSLTHALPGVDYHSVAEKQSVPVRSHGTQNAKLHTSQHLTSESPSLASLCNLQSTGRNPSDILPPLSKKATLAHIPTGTMHSKTSLSIPYQDLPENIV